MKIFKTAIFSIIFTALLSSSTIFAINITCPETVNNPHYLFGGLFVDFGNSIDNKTLIACHKDRLLAENIGITKFQRSDGHNRYDHFVHLYGKIGIGVHIYVDEGTEYPLPNSYWYFDNVKGSTDGDGTYEHPFKIIDAKAYNLIASAPHEQNNPVIYLANTGVGYELKDLSNDNRLILPKDYALYGRTDDFKLAAVGAERPEIIGSIAATGNNILSDLQLSSHNFGFATSGALQLINATNIDLNNVKITDSEAKNDVYGIYAITSSLTLNNSTIIVDLISDKLAKEGLDKEGSHAVGIFLDKNSTLTLVGDNNDIIANSDGYNTRTGGIALTSSVLAIAGDNNLISATSTGNENKAVAIVSDSGTATIFGNNNQISAKSAASNSIGIMANSSVFTVLGSENLISADTFGENSAALESNAGGIVGLKSTTQIIGNFNRINVKAEGKNGKALGIGNFSAGGMTSSADKTAANNNITGEIRISIAGNNNQIIATSSENNALGIGNTGALLIPGNNNLTSANTNNPNNNAFGIFDFGSSNKAITGSDNKVISVSGSK